MFFLTTVSICLKSNLRFCMPFLNRQHSTVSQVSSLFISESLGLRCELTFKIKTGSRYFFSLTDWDPLNPTADKSYEECVLFQIAGEESSFPHHSPELWFTQQSHVFSRVPVGDLFVKVAFVIDFSSPCQLQKVKQMFPRLLQQSSSLTPRGKWRQRAYLCVCVF